MTLAQISMHDMLPWLAMLAGSMALAFAYSGMETGIYVLNKVRLELRAESGAWQARLLRRLMRNTPDLLTVLLIGVNVANYAATFAISTLFVLGGYGEAAEWYAIALSAPLLFIFAESVPKNVFQRLAERLSYKFVWFIGMTSVLLHAIGLAQLVRGFSTLMVRLTGKKRSGGPTHESLAALVAEGHASGVLTHSQSIMADRVMKMAGMTLRDVMTPMGKVVWAPVGAGADEVMRLVETHNFSRLPMRSADGQIVGVLDVMDVLAPLDDSGPSAKATEPMIMPDSMTLTDAMYHMQQAQARMAVVATPRGKHVGIVTLKDLVEEIVGELEAW